MLADDQLGALIARFGAQDLITRGVLLVDDEPPNLKVLKSFLEEDYKVYQVASGAEALALAEKTPLDVVIADQRMPGMTGTELLGRLRAVRPDVAGILLTAFAGSAQPEDRFITIASTTSTQDSGLFETRSTVGVEPRTQHHPRLHQGWEEHRLGKRRRFPGRTGSCQRGR